MNYQEFISKKNEKVFADYSKNLATIKEINNKTKNSDNKYLVFCNGLSGKILFYSELEKKYSENYYLDNSLENLEKENKEIYNELSSENFEKSYLNPDFCVNEFGREIGQVITAFYTSYRSYINYAMYHKIFEMDKKNKLFLDFYDYIVEGKVEKESMLEITTKIDRYPTAESFAMSFHESYDPKITILSNIIKNADLSDFRYLYQYTRNITSNEIKTAEFLANYPEEKIQILAEQMTNAYIRGFDLAEKDITKKETALVIYRIGQERIVRALIQKLKENDLQAVIMMPGYTSPNKQYSYDHRFDNALYFDRNFVDTAIGEYTKGCDLAEDIMRKYSGAIYFDEFGEKPFVPKAKESCLKLSEEQQKLMQEYTISNRKIRDKYIPRTETSFCIIGFPVPEIGEKFSEIFDETMKINMLDTFKYEEIQQKIVDVLDKADFVHVKGKDGNETDIKVKMQKLEDPEKHTNFVNCGADVNIPVGEVFTSPKLTGTNGVLHVKDAFLNNLNFKDIKLTFTDGYTTEYTCNNFEKEDENVKFIQENLLFPHKQLPLGEFAIGTNTMAYVMAQKFDILPLLPILIVEKMGPHFAIGDTCFSWEEDRPVYNPIDKKEITARDNEHSINRKTDLQKAYTNCHTDITLPYEDLDFITAVSETGERFDIIRDGRFVVPGTEFLNEPLDK